LIVDGLVVLPVLHRVAFRRVEAPIVAAVLRRAVHGIGNHGVEAGRGDHPQQVQGIAVEHLVDETVQAWRSSCLDLAGFFVDRRPDFFLDALVAVFGPFFEAGLPFGRSGFWSAWTGEASVVEAGASSYGASSAAGRADWSPASFGASSPGGVNFAGTDPVAV